MNDPDVTLYEDIVLREDKREETLKTTIESAQNLTCPPCGAENETKVEDFEKKMTSFPATREDMNDIYDNASPSKTKRRESLISSIFINVASFLDV